MDGETHAKINLGNQRWVKVSSLVQSSKKKQKKYGEYGEGEIHAKISQGEPCCLF